MPVQNLQLNIGSGSLLPKTPVLKIFIDEDNESTVRATSVTVTFAWDRAMNGFTAGDHRLEWYNHKDLAGFTDNFTGTDGDSTYTTDLHIPDNATGEVDIIVNANVATDAADANNAGPPARVVLSIVYNTLPKTVAAPTVQIALPPDPPIANTNFPIFIQWSESIGGFSLSDMTLEIGGTVYDVISNLVDLRDEKIYRANVALPNLTGTVAIKIAANSVQGSQRTGPATEYTKTFTIGTAIDKGITNSTTILEETRTYAQKSGAYGGVLEMLAYGGFIYVVVQIVNNRDSTPTDFLAWDTRGRAELLRIRMNDGQKTVLGTYDDVLTAPRSLHIYDAKLHFFRGSHYVYEYPAEVYKDGDLDIEGYLMKSAMTPDWRGEIGGWYQLDGNTIKEVGRIGQSIVANPDTEVSPYNPYYGVHGGMASPMQLSVDVVDPLKRNVHGIAGYGKLSLIGANLIADKEADRLLNWNFGAFTETLEQRVPVLETNGKTGWEVIKALAHLSQSRIGFRGNTFEMEPSAWTRAKVATALTASANTLLIKELNQLSIPSSGYIKIGLELIRYTGFSALTLSGLARGFYETTAAAHAVDTEIIFFDHFIDEFVDLNTETDEETLYNVIKLTYAENQTVEKSDADSISKYRRLELDIEVPLAQDQKDWAEQIAEGFLETFKDAKDVITFTADFDKNWEVGDVIVVRQSDRAHINDIPAVIKETAHQLIAQTTRLTVLTI